MSTALTTAEDALALAEERLRAIREGRAQTVALDDAIARLSAGQPVCGTSEFPSASANALFALLPQRREGHGAK